MSQLSRSTDVVRISFGLTDDGGNAAAVGDDDDDDGDDDNDDDVAVGGDEIPFPFHLLLSQFSQY